MIIKTKFFFLVLVEGMCLTLHDYDLVNIITILNYLELTQKLLMLIR